MKPIWSGQTVVCIASGPSLTQADCDLVCNSGLTTIAVNDSWQLAPFCKVLYAGDKSWWAKHRTAITITPERWTCSKAAAVKYALQWHETRGAYNSGQRAIELALQRGAFRVLLIGYDCSIKLGMHWHGPHHGLGNPTVHRCNQWKPHFARIEANCPGRVINCSRKTELECFAKGVLETELWRATNEQAAA